MRKTQDQNNDLSAREQKALEYNLKFAAMAKKMIKRGYTVSEVFRELREFGVSPRTFFFWRVQHAEFREAFVCSKEELRSVVERALHKLAFGYYREVESVRLPHGSREPRRFRTRQYVPPDPAASKFWLNNKNPANWQLDRAPPPASAVDPEEAQRRWQILVKLTEEDERRQRES